MASLNPTVLNVNTDDFESYAGDGIGNEWQVQNFGQLPNSAAGPPLDPDSTGEITLELARRLFARRVGTAPQTRLANTTGHRNA